MRVLCWRWVFAVPLLAADCPPAGLSPAQAEARFHEIEARAGRLFQQGEFAKAAEELRNAVCLAPANPRAHHALGLAEAAAGQFDRARQALEQASRLAPQDPAILLAQAQVEASLGNFDAARRALVEAAPFESNDVATSGLHAQLARQFLQQKQPDLALAELLRARKSGQADAETLFFLARLENTLGAYSDAGREASQLENDSTLPARLRAASAAVAGLAWKNLDRPDDAIPHLRRAIELGNAELGAVLETACLALAEVYQMKQDSAAARAVLEQGRKRLPDSRKLALTLGRNLAESGDGAAIPLLKDLIAKSPAEDEAYKWLAQAYTALGEIRLATETLEQLARRRPDYPMIDVMIAQSILKEEQPNYPRALDYLARAEAASPFDPDIYYLRGKTYLTLARYEQAVEALRRAIELAPTAVNSYYQLGLAYQKLGKTALAKEQFDRMSYLRGAASPAASAEFPQRP